MNAGHQKDLLKPLTLNICFTNSDGEAELERLEEYWRE